MCESVLTCIHISIRMYNTTHCIFCIHKLFHIYIKVNINHSQKQKLFLPHCSCKLVFMQIKEMMVLKRYQKLQAGLHIHHGIVVIVLESSCIIIVHHHRASSSSSCIIIIIIIIIINICISTMSVIYSASFLI